MITCKRAYDNWYLYKWPQPEIGLTLTEIFISEENGQSMDHHYNTLSREPSLSQPSQKRKPGRKDRKENLVHLRTL
jgi:hypothetical protein